jgi:hypothetical protein
MTGFKKKIIDIPQNISSPPMGPCIDISYDNKTDSIIKL